MSKPTGDPQAGTLSYIINHPKLINFIMYSLSFMFFGMVWTCLGPLFPYFSAISHRSETEYSFLFTCRALGFITGSISIKLFQSKLSLHHFVGLGTCLMGFFFILFNFFDTMWLKGACIFLSSIGCAFQDITTNLSALHSFQGEHVALWLQMIHGFFGVGGLIGPFVVYLFQLHTMIIIGIGSMLVSIFYFNLPSPEHEIKQQQQQKTPDRNIPQLSLYLLAISFFFTVGQEAAYGGWISSFAVLNQFSTKQHATMYSSIYWISITFFRFAFALVKGSPTYKVIYLGGIGVASSFIGYFIIYNIDPEWGIDLMSILYGLCNSVIYALLLTIPQQFGFKLTIKQSIVFVIWASMGQGCLAVGVGLFMGWFSYDWLIYGMGIMDLAIMGLVYWNQGVMDKEKKKFEDGMLLGKRQGNQYQMAIF